MAWGQNLWVGVDSSLLSPRAQKPRRGPRWPLESAGLMVPGESIYGGDDKCPGPAGLCLHLMACSSQVNRSREVEPAWCQGSGQRQKAGLRLKRVFCCIKGKDSDRLQSGASSYNFMSLNEGKSFAISELNVFLHKLKVILPAARVTVKTNGMPAFLPSFAHSLKQYFWVQT